MAEPAPLQLGESITVLFPLRVRGPRACGGDRVDPDRPSPQARDGAAYWCLRRCFSARRARCRADLAMMAVLTALRAMRRRRMVLVPFGDGVAARVSPIARRWRRRPGPGGSGLRRA